MFDIVSEHIELSLIIKHKIKKIFLKLKSNVIVSNALVDSNKFEFTINDQIRVYFYDSLFDSENFLLLPVTVHSIWQ